MSGKQKSRAVPIAERRAHVARLQRAGLSVREVAAELGCSVGTVQSDRQALISMCYEVALEDMGAWKAATLEAYRRKLEHIDTVLGEVDGEKLAPLFGAWVKMDERVAKLLGTDAPTHSVVTSQVEPMSEARAREILDESDSS